MSFVLYQGSLHWKTKCQCEICQDDGECDEPIYVYTKVEAEKPKEIDYDNANFSDAYKKAVAETPKDIVKAVRRHGDLLMKEHYNSQLSIIKELEEALMVEKPELPYRFRLSSDIVKKSYRKELRAWLEAQETKSKYTLSEGKIVNNPKELAG